MISENYESKENELVDTKRELDDLRKSISSNNRDRKKENQESSEEKWFDIKKTYENLRDSLIPYKGISERANEYMERAFNFASEKSSNWEWVWKKKKWLLKYRDKEWNNCMISVSDKRKMWLDWVVQRKCISIKRGEKFYTLNWDLKSWLWREPFFSQLANVSSHFYLTDNKGHVTKDNLTVREAAVVLNSISGSLIDYQLYSEEQVKKIVK